MLLNAKSKEDYKAIMDVVLDWAVEIPFYGYYSYTLVSGERVDLDTFPKDLTSWYGCMREIENIAVK